MHVQQPREGDHLRANFRGGSDAEAPAAALVPSAVHNVHGVSLDAEASLRQCAWCGLWPAATRRLRFAGRRHEVNLVERHADLVHQHLLKAWRSVGAGVVGVRVDGVCDVLLTEGTHGHGIGRCA